MEQGRLKIFDPEEVRAFAEARGVKAADEEVLTRAYQVGLTGEPV